MGELLYFKNCEERKEQRNCLRNIGRKRPL